MRASCGAVLSTIVWITGLAAGGCTTGRPPASSGRFDADVAFLRQYTNVILLADSASGSRVVLAPAYQGRVMTSTVGGPDAPSFGWLGRQAIRSGRKQPHMNVFGGEDRFWLGPEGGQYALYFKPTHPFDLDHWQVPDPIDWDRWDVAGSSTTSARFKKRIDLLNYAGTRLAIDVDRTIRLLPAADVAAHLGSAPGSSVRVVAFESSNTVANAGSGPWQPQSGLVSVWILGMFSPSPATTIVLPFTPGSESALGPIVND